jgi:folate-dependent phosphoribosylglycinamide formyltransferase PurN
MMPTEPEGSDQRIRVVMFGSGPQLNHDAKQFLYELDVHPEIELVGAFCQAKSQSILGVFMDLWQRRGFLAVPLFFAWITSTTIRFLKHPFSEIALRKRLTNISDRIHFVKKIHAPEVLDQVRALQPDLGLIYGSPILKPKLFEIPRLGTFGIHHGKLPHYRGNKTAFWAMFNGETVAGVTIQKVNAGLDTGSIVKEGEVDTVDKTYPSVVRELEALGIKLYIQAILEVKNGTANFKPQPESSGLLYRNPKPIDFLKFWLIQTKRRFGKA